MGNCSWLRSSTSAPTFTASNRAACFTRMKAFESNGARVEAVRAATADPLSGRTPADRGSGGERTQTALCDPHQGDFVAAHVQNLGDLEAGAIRTRRFRNHALQFGDIRLVSFCGGALIACRCHS